MKIKNVVVWTNGMVAVFDSFGDQVSELQGAFGMRAAEISALLEPETEIWFADWCSKEQVRIIDRESFDRLWKRGGEKNGQR